LICREKTNMALLLFGGFDLKFVLGVFVGVICIIFTTLLLISKRNARVAQWLMQFFVKYRWAFVILVVLPLSGLFDIFWFLRHHLIKSRRSHLSHQERVEEVQEQIRRWRASGSKKPLSTARPSWLSYSTRTSSYKTKCHPVKLDLGDVLEIDKENMIVRVEPMVNIGHLSRTLFEEGLTLAVMPDMEDITIAGLTMGYGLDSSSHVYGTFSETILRYEMVLADASVVYASHHENRELFNCLPMCYGTLGFITALDIKVIPAKKYAKIMYIPTFGLEETAEVFAKYSQEEKPHQLVEGLIFNEKRGVVLVGDFVDQVEEKSKMNSIGWWFKPWFYKHCMYMVSTCKVMEEYIPLRQYYQRYCRGIFWELELIIPFGNNLFFRSLYGWMLPPKVPFLKLTQNEFIRKYYEDHHVLQDVLVPVSILQETLKKFNQWLKVYPIRLCPCRHPWKEPNGLLKSARCVDERDFEMYVDVGVWGVPQSSQFQPVTSIRTVEDWAINNRCYQAMGVTYMTKEQYEQMFDTSLYQKVRQMYHAEGAFPHVYDKIKRQSTCGEL